MRIGSIARLAAIAFAIGFASPGFAAPIKLRFAAAGPAETNPLFKEVIEKWAKRVSDASGGELVIEPVGGMTLANPRNVWERVHTGIADIGFGIQGAVGRPFPKTYVVGLPFLVDDIVKGSVGLWKLYESGLIADEYKGVKVLALFTPPPSGLHSKEPIKTLADMDGRKVRVADKVSADAITALGGSPISIPVPDLYQALNSGVVSTVLVGWTAVGTFRLYEVTTQHLDVDLGCPPGFVIMNEKAYAKLPPKAKAAIDANSGAIYSKMIGEFFVKNGQEEEAKVKALPGHTIRSLSADELAKWKTKVAPVTAAWAKSVPKGHEILKTLERAMTN